MNNNNNNKYLLFSTQIYIKIIEIMHFYLMVLKEIHNVSIILYLPHHTNTYTHNNVHTRV